MGTAFCSQYAGAWKAPWLQLSLFTTAGMMIMSNFNKKHPGHLPHASPCAQHCGNEQSWGSNLGLRASRAGVPNLWVWTGASCQISTDIRLETKCTINVMCLNHPESTPLTPGVWKNCLLKNLSLVPKRLGTTAVGLSTLYLTRCTMIPQQNHSS